MMDDTPSGGAMAELSAQDRRARAVMRARIALTGNERLGRESPEWIVKLVADWDREHPLPV